MKSLNNANLNIRGTLDVSKNELTNETIFEGISEGLGGKNENFSSDIRVKKFIGINQQPDGIPILNTNLKKIEDEKLKGIFTNLATFTKLIDAIKIQYPKTDTDRRNGCTIIHNINKVIIMIIQVIYNN